jgi:DNA-binding CsgD family transcriptional regulator
LTPSRLVLVVDRFLLDSELLARRLGAVARAEALRPDEPAEPKLDGVDLVLLDVSAPDHVLADLQRRGVAVGLLHDGVVPRDRRHHPAVRLLISRSSPPDELRDAVQRVLSGEVHRDATAHHGPGTRAPALSPRESDVLALLARGLANRDIADELDISPHTVRTHVQALLFKLDRGNRVAAVGAARQAGLLPR